MILNGIPFKGVSEVYLESSAIQLTVVPVFAWTVMHINNNNDNINLMGENCIRLWILQVPFKSRVSVTL